MIKYKVNGGSNTALYCCGWSLFSVFLSQLRFLFVCLTMTCVCFCQGTISGQNYCKPCYYLRTIYKLTKRCKSHRDWVIIIKCQGVTGPLSTSPHQINSVNFSCSCPGLGATSDEPLSNGWS